MDSGSETVSLYVKTPNQLQEVVVVERAQVNWTVRELKTHLSAVYPTKPAVSDQKLIYGGKLLPDHVRIRELFKEPGSSLTVHLVLPPRSLSPASPGARPKTREAADQPSTSGFAPAASASPTLRQRRHTSSPAAAEAPSPPPECPPTPLSAAPHLTPPAFPNFSLYSPQQLLWLQHVYARQYYMQYHAALAAAAVPSAATPTVVQHHPVPAHQVPVPAALANQNPIDNLPVNQNPAQDGAFIDPAGANQNLRMNAQGGAVMEDEEDLERDWLDWLYSAARFGVLLMIVYFNSNLSRFLLVMSTLFLMYLHTAGLFPFRRPAPAQGPNLQQPQEAQQNQENDERVPNHVEAEDRPAEEAGAAEADPMVAVLVPPHRVSAMWTMWVFFKTFFLSLIPEAPHGVAN
ncbi:homocysteine-responsive endoplasmic reticulum-resident ubiquitin-like domain member 1 protein [Synchiropus splendidus]|uniref:homocysteine-responsive endoplasmic reticulum-resident ubiquitin-like domain member 1 protein n=1 Tax=Synchiropus splendidus TaxID=270530 RepID=UPI00237D8946|nr:homocysteine-responsive endoplasmic reticulum-resident ubiquitin-like domain member 1 protein [Synchiropus splendidus]